MTSPGSSARRLGPGELYHGYTVTPPFPSRTGSRSFLNYARRRLTRDQGPMVKLVVKSAVESLPANTSIVVVSITQSRTAAFQ